jgi:hypothetical protein
MKVKIGAVEIEITSGYLRYDADSDTVFLMPSAAPTLNQPPQNDSALPRKLQSLPRLRGGPKAKTGETPPRKERSDKGVPRGTKNLPSITLKNPDYKATAARAERNMAANGIDPKQTREQVAAAVLAFLKKEAQPVSAQALTKVCLGLFKSIDEKRWFSLLLEDLAEAGEIITTLPDKPGAKRWYEIAGAAPAAGQG